MIVDLSADQTPLLNGRGCLTAEAMCFVEQLRPEQSAVVERHVRKCPSCAQQRGRLSTAAERLRTVRYAPAVPIYARLAAQQAVYRLLVGRRKRMRRERLALSQLRRALADRKRRWQICSVLFSAGALLAVAVWVQFLA